MTEVLSRLALLSPETRTLLAKRVSIETWMKLFYATPTAVILRDLIPEISRQEFERAIGILPPPEAGALARSTTEVIAAIEAIECNTPRDWDAPFPEVKSQPPFPSGWDEFDRMTGGLAPGRVLVVASRPSVGKTAFALSLIRSALDSDSSRGAALFTMELSAEEVALRMLAIETQLSRRVISSGKLTDHDRKRLAAAAHQTAERQIFTCFDGGLTDSEIHLRSRQLKEQHPSIDIVVVDYLQLLRGTPSGPDWPRELQIAAMSHSLSILAKTLGVAVVVLSQINRRVRNTDMRPRLTDLRDCRSIEAVADTVLFLFRPQMYKEKTATPGETEVIVAKSRYGSAARLLFTFDAKCARFSPLGEPLARAAKPNNCLPAL